MKSYDLIIVGAGIIGTACADYASQQGLRVAIVEPGPIGGGATAAAMGHLVAMDDDPAELALANYSLGLWEDFTQVAQIEYNRCGTLWVASSDAEYAHIPEKIARLAAVGVQAELIDGEQLYRLEPALQRGLAGGMHVAREAVVYPPGMARHLLDRARARGALLYSQRVTAITQQGVQLDDQTSLAGSVLVATGCALPELLPQLPMRARKGHLVITDRYPGLIHHQLLELGYADSAHGDADSSVAFNVQPRPTGQILIGSSREYGSETSQVSMPMIQRMLERTFRYLPALRQLDALRIWTGFRPVSADGLPYLGRVPEHTNVWVAAGHEGLGITTSLGSARLVIDQWLGRAAAIDARPYDPARAVACV
ncbi:D-amino acid oxidase [Dyella nitratireducens]|uniref:D-amino acid oxidase n=1 Tax=Dyella nitratireducens TaxID=1849580 RepID=A0ABQ1FZK6_9GAMM|nr:FAD-dependent oxidoreductase [Dyella nitratireducens]GGA33903.1 D-amino acid oxidase [Dyella nitratireducens]GLQ40792.1 D-amino acid oxidase [Dyella nitratireducens]